LLNIDLACKNKIDRKKWTHVAIQSPLHEQHACPEYKGLNTAKSTVFQLYPAARII